MRTPMYFAALLALLFCGVLTACSANTDHAKPGRVSEPPPVKRLSDTAKPAAVTPYDLGQGTKELFYDSHWKLFIQEHEPEPSPNSYLGASSLICRDLTTGNEWVLEELGYGSRHGYWDSVQLYSFTDILGCDGFIFRHGIGAAYEAFDFYEVTDTGVMQIAQCTNNVYTADLDGDGQLELLSNYHNMGYLDLFWAEGENHIVCSCSLNETARDYLGLVPGSWVHLGIREGSGEIFAGWSPSETGGLTEKRTLDLTSLWKWEKARTEFWDVLPFYTDDGRAVDIRLRESRSRPDDLIFRNYYRVNEIQVYDGGELVQSISADDLSYDGEYLFEGLFVVHSFNKVPREPDIRDFNLDGSNDLGLMAEECFSRNVSYCYFLWDPQAGRLSTDFFVLFAPLTVDKENRQLIEPVSGGGPYRSYPIDALTNME